MASLTITIEIEGGNLLAKIKDDAGNEKIVNGLCLFGYDARMGDAGDAYTFAWGAPKDAAFAFAEGMARAVATGDPWYAELYRLILLQMCMRTETRPNEKKVTAEEIEQRWATSPVNENGVAKCDCLDPICQHKVAKKKVALLGAEAIVEDETPEDWKKKSWN